MASQAIRNIDLFKKYNIPYREFAKDQIVIDTAKISYLVDLVPIKNNPYVFKVFNMTGNRTTIESKDTFLRRLCKHFKLDFVHWKENVDVVEMLKKLTWISIVSLIYVVSSCGDTKSEAERPLNIDEASILADVLWRNHEAGGAHFRLVAKSGTGEGDIAIEGDIDWVKHLGYRG